MMRDRVRSREAAASPVFELAGAGRRCFNFRMAAGYGEFCPIAKASEVFATRWTPLVLRELMSGAHSFNDIHRGVPLMSRALLAERLRQLEQHGLVEKSPRSREPGCDYWLTPAGGAFHDVLRELARWGLVHARDRQSPEDLNPGLLMWRLRRRADLRSLPAHRVVTRFDFSGVARSRTCLQIMWLILERSGVDVCFKDPGFAVDVTVRCDVSVLVRIYLGHARWEDEVGRSLSVDGDPRLARRLPVWLQLDKLIGRDYLPLKRPAT
jgi:DNA-binding HxlR family transcriptional regulator